MNRHHRNPKTGKLFVNMQQARAKALKNRLKGIKPKREHEETAQPIKARACKKPSRDVFEALSKDARKAMHKLRMKMKKDRRVSVERHNVEFHQRMKAGGVARANLSRKHPRYGNHPNKAYNV